MPWGIVFCSFGILLGFLSEQGIIRFLPTIKSKYGAVPQTVVECVAALPPAAPALWQLLAD